MKESIHETRLGHNSGVTSIRKMWNRVRLLSLLTVLSLMARGAGANDGAESACAGDNCVNSTPEVTSAPPASSAAAGGARADVTARRSGRGSVATTVAEHIEDPNAATSQTVKPAVTSVSAATSGSSAATTQKGELLPISLPNGVDKSGVTGKTLSMPKGEGTIDGMGESFSAQLSTGIATYSVPIVVPKARGNVSVNLALSYSSSSGNGLAGVGWDIGVPFISRQTDRGLPSYEDRDTWHLGQDRFVFNGGQELVPICTVAAAASGNGSTCAGALPGEAFPDYLRDWQYFRPRVEGSFQRFFWSKDHRTWLVQDKSGVTLELGVPLNDGTYTAALDVNPEPASPQKPEIFRWHIVRQYDSHFSNIAAPLNSVVYHWVQDGNQAYLSDVYDTPKVTDTLIVTSPNGYAHRVHLEYEPRTDPSQSYRSGWRIDQSKRLSRIDVSSMTFTSAAEDGRRLVRRYHLTYDPTYHASLLTQVQVEGRCTGDESLAPLEDQPSSCAERLPAMTFTYQHVEPFTTDEQAGRVDLPGYEGFDERLHSIASSPSHSVDERYTDLFDVNSDGLPDVLVTAAGLYGPGHGVFFNGGTGFGAVTPMSINGVLGADASIISLHNPNVSSLDLDGDGRVNLVHVPVAKTYAVYDAVQASGAWAWQGRTIDVATNQSVKIDFGRDAHDVQVVDVNFDGLVDVVVSTGTEWQTFFSLGRLPGGDGQFGHGEWASATTSHIWNDAVTKCVPHAGQPIRLSDKETKLADMNGDGIVDIVKLQRGQVRYWPGRGNGFWGTGKRDDCAAGTFGADRYVGMTSSPYWTDLSGDTLRIEDVNGDGLSDIVQIRFDAVDIWLNVDGVSFTERHIIDKTPPSPSYALRVRLTDINGSGTPDVLWANSGNYQYIDLTGGKRPHLLVGVSNGLGKQTTLEYSTSTQEMIAAEANGACDPSSPPADIWSKGWCSKMPTVTSVVKTVTETDQLTVAGKGPSTLVTTYEYRDPVFEGRQREFRGFRHARATRGGDANSPSDVTESSFLLGECSDSDASDGIDACALSQRWRDNGNEALKGLPWLTQRRSSDGIYLSSEITNYRLRRLYSGLDGRAVKHAVAVDKTGYLYDTASAQSPGAVLVKSIVEHSEFIANGSSITESVGASILEAFTPRANSVVTWTENEVDAFGNQTKSIAHGCISGCEQGVDEVITTFTNPGQVTTSATQWLWRTIESYTTGSRHGGEYQHQTISYNQYGEPTQVFAALRGSLPLDRGFAHPTKGKAPDPSDASVDTSTPAISMAYTEYDAFGNPTHFEGPSGRCAEVQYDSNYVQLAVSETLYTQGCGSGTALTTTATFDRGLGKVTDAYDVQNQHTRVVYDGFGRTTQLWKPDPVTAGALSPKASVVIEYFLPPSLGNSALSAIHTRTENGIKLDDSAYLDAWAFVDGFGRTRARLSEAEAAGQWVVSGLVTHDAKGAVQRKYVETYYQGDPQAFPISNAPGSLYGSQRYDAFGRALQTFDLDGTVTLQTRYHAQSKDLYDAADLETGTHQDTYATEVTDGHGRVLRATERVKVSGQIEQRHVLTFYSPLGAPEIITRHRGAGTSAPDDVVRWMHYDTLGRMVLNVDPHTSVGFQSPPEPTTGPVYVPSENMHGWRYAYNDAGDLVGTSDARGCGSNFVYDTVGRLLGEDYSPCELHHADYSDPGAATPAISSATQNWETVYAYDSAPATTLYPVSFNTAFSLGHLVAVADRGALSATEYDGRARVTRTARRIAKPATPGQTPNALEQRYAPRWYFAATAYDAADRPALTSAGLLSPELLGAQVGDANLSIASNLGQPDFSRSIVTSQYTSRGTLAAVAGSYGEIIHAIQRRADGLVQSVTYGDLAGTVTSTSYDGRRRPTSIQTFRAAPGQWTTNTPGYTPAPAPGGTSTSFQLLLQDLDITYDVVGNPTEIRDWRDPAEWPVGAKPVTRKIAYDDLYRVRRVKYEYSTNDEDWVSPYLQENSESASNRDHRRSAPSPHVNFEHRILQQDIEYDWRGNTITSDDDAHGFYDRSLGEIVNDTAQGKPYQLASASNTEAGGARTGSLETKYDVAGNLTDMDVARSGACLPSGSSCNQRFRYGWDEVGRLVRAQRWDTATPVNQEPTGTLAVDLAYTYDASDNRVLKSATANEGANGDVQRHAVYISGGQELRGAKFEAQYGTGSVADYQLDSTTEVAYLFAHGVRLGRVAYDTKAGTSDGMPLFSAINPLPQQHVLINLDDTLGSTAIVIDRETGELVESAAYLAFGGTESDYRAERWKGLREDYRFTGKEEDVEVGLQYFGKRFLSPHLGRWVSADPLAVHVPGKADFNLYAYVHGRVLQAVDPVGLDELNPEASVKYQSSPNAEGKSDQNYTFSQGTEDTINAKAPHRAYSDQDKVADSLGVPRAEIQNGAPTGEATDRARMALPGPVRNDRTLQPLANRDGVQGWTTEHAGVRRLHDLTGRESGYAGEKAAQPTMSPLDLAAPAAVRGLWALGGRALRLSEAAREEALYRDALAARDDVVRAFQLFPKKDIQGVSTVVGGYNRVTGEVTVGTKWFSGKPFCAEDLVVKKLGGDAKDVVMTPAIRPWGTKVIDPCPHCQLKYPSSFGPGTNLSRP